MRNCTHASKCNFALGQYCMLVVLIGLIVFIHMPVQCKPYELGTLYPGEYSYLTVETNFEYTLIFDNQSDSIICRLATVYDRCVLLC